ncbi:MAG: IS200/IS605 family transposase [Bacteroidetes bacterium]|nr:IS200/IS605 family transposase [Bacteroidota bacterium]
MADTYSQISIQVIFAVRNRESSIRPEFRDELYKYLSGILAKKGQKLLAINGTTNHIHLFFGMTPTICLSDLVRDLKSDSTLFINSKFPSKFKFSWQEGYGAFSYGRSQRDTVIRYINNQEDHHKKHSFREEYLSFLKTFDIEYDTKYAFEFFED